MKRSLELVCLSRDHHQSLVLAKRCKAAGANLDSQATLALCQRVVEEFESRWEPHFCTEEEAIFAVAQGLEGPIAALCQELRNEHSQLRSYYKQIATGDHSTLADFGDLLQRHTLREERELFPLVESQFSAAQMAAILAASHE